VNTASAAKPERRRSARLACHDALRSAGFFFGLELCAAALRNLSAQRGQWDLVLQERDGGSRSTGRGGPLAGRQRLQSTAFSPGNAELPGRRA
jgi:hypothetical protein